MERSDIEILAPAGSWEALRAALAAGADAVYFGVGTLNMRSKGAANFSADDLPKIVCLCRGKGVRTRLTVNTAIYENELQQMRATIDAASEAGVDAIIASDMATILYASSKKMEVHISTQLNVSNSESFHFFSQWASTIVLARELSLEQVRAIAYGAGATRIEMFAHGALCMAVSGRCYLSTHDCGESANRGACRQLCRRSYTLTDTETGTQIVSEGGTLLSPKDLCTLPFLDKMLAAGGTVLKIEGRARSAEYVKRTVEVYREAVEAVLDGTFSATKVEGWVERLKEVFNRGFWEGYYLGASVPELTREYGSSATRKKVYIGRVTNFFRRLGVAEIAVEAAPIAATDELLIIGPTTGVMELTAAGIMVDDRPATTAPQGIRCSLLPPRPARRGDKVFKLMDN